MKDDSMMHSGRLIRPMQRRLRSCADAPERVQDIECNLGLYKFNELLNKDSRESGCTHYLVFEEGDGRYLAWRDEN